MPKAISIRQVTKAYEPGPTGTPVISGVDLDIEHGEVVMLMGPSGSGKTTLLSIMGCILRPTSGSVKICGEETAGLSEEELPRVRLTHMGFIFQGFNLFSTLTVRENVELVIDIKELRDRRARYHAVELLRQVGLGEKLDSFPADLSGGQKQRVAIARAMIGDPDIVLADEPTASLDSKQGRLILEMLRHQAQELARAVVIVSHDFRAIEFADRVIEIEDGHIAGARAERDRRSFGPVAAEPIALASAGATP